MSYQGEYTSTRVVFSVGTPIGALGSTPVIQGVTGGFAITSGRGDDSFVSAARNTDTFTVTVGVDGDATHSRSNDKTGDITLVLTDGSGFNGLFAALHAAQEAEDVPDFVFPVTVSDNNATPPSLVVGTNCKISRPADFERGAVAGNTTWVFRPDKITVTHTGRVF